ncbi:helix-turn-helix transcriptional regulator [Clostridium thermosuccinogenes]|nr:AraC family transcriptional regulator [Pseudoclostridium thermosuccinogenes]
MNWIQCLSKSIQYIEEHITDRIRIDEIANQAYTSSSHFQLLFHLVFGITVGEYIRNRRLTLAALELLKPGRKIIDVAMQYQYDTQESFSKAFARFHGFPPSKVQADKIRMFHPLKINITVQGGFDMSRSLVDEFYWSDFINQKDELLSDIDKYQRIVNWAIEARVHNPNVFDALTEWILDDSEWTDDKLVENEQIFMQGILARFRGQNAQLRAYLKEIESSGIVNGAVFNALDRFDNELSGKTEYNDLRNVITKMFTDFSVMRDRKIREQIAGGKTGPTGTDSVDIFGYVNLLKDCDARVQWTLFMPDMVEKQKKDFKIEKFEYMKMPAMRFIGKESCEGDGLDTVEGLKNLFSILDTMSEYKSGFDYDVLFQHHYGRGVDVERWHGFWGRFMKADTPVPEGFVYFDFTPQRTESNFVAGPPYISQFAFAVFSGNIEAMHEKEGYDCDAMYDITRNIILGQDVNIPYPDKYWTAEVFLDGYDNYSTAYMFSVEL